LAKRLVKDWYQVTVITNQFEHGLAVEELREGIQIIRTWSNRFLFQFGSIWKAWKIIRKNKIDVIHGSSLYSIIPTRFISKISWIKSFVTVHEVYGKLRLKLFGIRGLVYYLYECLCFRLFSFDYFACVSRYTLNSVRLLYGIPDSKLKMIYNGMDYEFRNPEMLNPKTVSTLRNLHELGGKYVWLFYGRWGKVKGLQDVLEAYDIIRDSIPNFVLLVINGKTKNDSLNNADYHMHRVDEEDGIIELQNVHQTQLRDWIWLSDIVILPSHAEWFGFAVSEVCAMGKPLVTTAIGSIPEVVYGNINFAIAWDSHDIANKVIDMYDNKFETISEKKFSWEDCVEGYEKLYLN
jgi:glycosyltransferase involved in cell wall biosynthesis